MTIEDKTYKEKKVISIGIVSELTGLSVRQIRYYEERKLIYPQRSTRGTRKYSFSDVEKLMEIANKREDGVQTAEILKDMRRREQINGQNQLRNKMLEGQLNAHFKYRNR
jgi:DNA-binding transcriptional MerR regulator